MEQIWRILAFIFAVIGIVNGGGEVQNFTVSSHLVQSGTDIVFRYRVKESHDMPTTVFFKKHFGNSSWDMLDNNERSESIMNDDRFVVAFQRYDETEEDEYTVTIKNAQNKDTGNYSASTKTTSMSVSVNVTSEPQDINMKLDGVMVNTSRERRAIPEKVLELNKVYKLECVVGKGNPFPHVIIKSGDNVVGPVDYQWETFREPAEAFSGQVDRQTTATINSWTFGVEHVGKPLKCQAGAFQPTVIETMFIPTIDDNAPKFHCNDTAYFTADQKELSVTCQVYSQTGSMSYLYVHWMMEKNMTLQADLSKHVDQKTSGEDHRFSLKTTSARPHLGEKWWTMLLEISSPERVNNLPGTQLTFVANNEQATATHVVTVKKEGHDGRDDDDSGAGPMSTLSMSALLTVLVVALGLTRQ